MLPPLDCRQNWRMPFNPRRAFNIQVAGIATIVLSVAAVAVLSIFRLVNAAGREQVGHWQQQLAPLLLALTLAGFFKLSHVFDGALRRFSQAHESRFREGCGLAGPLV